MIRALTRELPAHLPNVSAPPAGTPVASVRPFDGDAARRDLDVGAERKRPVDDERPRPDAYIERGLGPAPGDVERDDATTGRQRQPGRVAGPANPRAGSPGRRRATVTRPAAPGGVRRACRRRPTTRRIRPRGRPARSLPQPGRAGPAWRVWSTRRLRARRARPAQDRQSSRQRPIAAAALSADADRRGLGRRLDHRQLDLVGVVLGRRAGFSTSTVEPDGTWERSTKSASGSST